MGSARALRLWVARVGRRTPPMRGKARTLRAFERAIRRVDGGPVPIEVPIGGVRFALDPRERIAFSILYLGAYEREVREVLAALIGRRSAPVVWDVGANIGAVGLPLLADARDLRIEAFEPSPTVGRRLALNVALNPALSARIRVHAVALADRGGEMPFFESGEPGNSGLGSLAAMANTAQRGVAVAVRTADALIAAGEVAPPDAVKIDVEGFEREVLLGMKGVLEGDRPPPVVFEHAPYRLEGRGLPPDAVTRWLEERGFTLSRVRPGPRLEPLRDAHLSETFDVLAASVADARAVDLALRRKAGRRRP